MNSEVVAWASLDGCHLPLKCLAGGLEACKEYYNLKNFYSIIVMEMADGKYRFIQASCGYPGNSHDSTIFKSTKVWEDMTDRKGYWGHNCFTPYFRALSVPI